NLKEKLSTFDTEEQMRIWLIENIKGFGMKEASHFLRNIGYKDIAIIDFHIINFLVKHNLIRFQKKSSLSIKKYLEIENILRELADKTGLSLGELDLYLWYAETGKVLK
ncbi:MAG: N-glycosylase, partial [Candidatus Pacearchaeota archaeon]